MRFVIIVLAFFISIFTADGKSGPKIERAGFSQVDTVAMESSVREFLQRYPQATLQDVYKNNFQDYFGPAHIMAKREGVMAYLKSELEQMEKEVAPQGMQGSGYYTPCGWRNNYFQVSLYVIKDGIITIGEFADAFIAGGGGVPEVDDKWLQEWELLKSTVKKVAPEISGYEEDAEKIDALLKEKKYVVHHSKNFENTYSPHYRIIRREIFEKVILPKVTR